MQKKINIFYVRVCWLIDIFVTGTHRHGATRTVPYRVNKFLARPCATGLKILTSNTPILGLVLPVRNKYAMKIQETWDLITCSILDTLEAKKEYMLVCLMHISNYNVKTRMLFPLNLNLEVTIA